MTGTRGEQYLATVFLTFFRSSVIGMVALFAIGNLNGQGTEKPAKAKIKSNQAKTSEPTLANDLDHAIQTLEKNDFRVFFERYAPVELLRRLRQEEMLEQAVHGASSQPGVKAQLLTILKFLRKETPTYDKSRGLATYQFDPNASDVVEANAGELHLPITDNLKLVGLGSDLKKVIAEAARLLAAGDVQTFIERLFPASELAGLQESGAMKDLVSRINNVPAAPKAPSPAGQKSQALPSLHQAFQADFKQLQTLAPELTDDGQVAIFQIESQNKQPPRVIKFQKAGTDWRLFDDVTRVAAELTRQSELKPRSNTTRVQMERVGGNWRFVEFPPIKMDGR